MISRIVSSFSLEICELWKRFDLRETGRVIMIVYRFECMMTFVCANKAFICLVGVIQFMEGERERERQREEQRREMKGTKARGKL